MRTSNPSSVLEGANHSLRVIESDGQIRMGTVLEITLVVDPDERVTARAEIAAAFAEVDRLENIFSTYRPQSDVSRLNGRAGTKPRADYSPELASLIRTAEAGRVATRGAFDVRVAPLLVLWQQVLESGGWPTEIEVETARRRALGNGPLVGEGGEVGLVHAGQGLDFGAIAKGDALDRIVDELVANGSRSLLLDFGGSSLWAMGRPAEGGTWRFTPGDTVSGGAAPVIALRDRALSVSASEVDTTSIEGRVIGHVVDPRSGWPVVTRRQAMVVGRSASLTEIWSTALIVLGPEEGLALVEGIPALEAWMDDEATGRHMTSGFGSLLARD